MHWITAQTYTEHLLESLERRLVDPVLLEIPQDDNISHVNDALMRNIVGKDEAERNHSIWYRHVSFRLHNYCLEYLDFVSDNWYGLLLDKSKVVTQLFEICNECRPYLFADIPNWLWPDPLPIEILSPIGLSEKRFLSAAYRKILGEGFEDAFDENGNIQKYDEETLKKRLEELGVLKPDGVADHQAIRTILTSND